MTFNEKGRMIKTFAVRGVQDLPPPVQLVKHHSLNQ
jgi:hypothetical protein